MESSTLGRCHICNEQTDVRWKNIYHIGSEGLWVCISCERDLCEYVRNKRIEFLEKERKHIFRKSSIEQNKGTY